MTCFRQPLHAMGTLIAINYHDQMDEVKEEKMEEVEKGFVSMKDNLSI